ncbi:hypothetical protein M1D96_06415 [Pseudomonas sp. D1-3]
MRLTESAGQAVAVYPAFRRVLGLSASAAQFLSQAVYWTEKTDDGWFYKTESEWADEIALSAKEVRNARRKLESLALLGQIRKGVPAKMFFRVDTDLLLDYLDGKKDVPVVAQEAEQDLPKGNNKTCPKGTTGSTQKAQLVLPKGNSLFCPNGTTITEITQKTTSEITAETIAAPSAPAKKVRHRKSSDEQDHEKQAACREIWMAYADAYQLRHGALPVRNAKVNRQVVELWKRLGRNSAPVASFFVSINDAYLVRNLHDFGLLLSKAEAYHTQWSTGRQMTGNTARQIENTQTNLSAAQQALAEQRARREANAHA